MTREEAIIAYAVSSAMDHDLINPDECDDGCEPECTACAVTQAVIAELPRCGMTEQATPSPTDVALRQACATHVTRWVVDEAEPDLGAQASTVILTGDEVYTDVCATLGLVEGHTTGLAAAWSEGFDAGAEHALAHPNPRTGSFPDPPTNPYDTPTPPGEPTSRTRHRKETP
jgi:hypothetical protein